MKSEPPGAPEHPAAILVVDDEEIVLMALRETLRRDGFEVVTATEPVEALRLLKGRQFAIIMADQQMPVLSGLELLSHAKQIQPLACRILTTAMLTVEMALDALNVSGIHRLILKPWAREDLLSIVGEQVDQFREREKMPRELDLLRLENHQLKQRLTELENGPS